ncbi:uncharacterized protein LOC116190389 isoform X2 [Punica granatum]|uniref:Viral late gene transcription factor 3 zinc ribbon domain-containing protein n=2 Tax=Punica granatum TaxID=22663 RepID=A0A218X9A1_PUNGR|nr:uncharacterized protein LOC116190389 isoform X2 [Punica granatum]OWM81348.1 hypothetical protein CDL15_Pgr007386 [Punica granatum]PKI50505.1 hypothetical protein CRG98_029110 [Punica granatum]
MEALLSPPPPFTAPKLLRRTRIRYSPKPGAKLIFRATTPQLPGTGKPDRQMKASAIDGVTAAADPSRSGVTWQIVVGAIAGVTPFVVAGIEFSKRIIKQRRCEVCGGSGLVLEEKEYFRCPGCGGFLPWQSWKRFFSG